MKNKILFEVFDENGVKVGQRHATREYVACLVNTFGNPHVMSTWFGRIDLIGKGDSRFSVGKIGIEIAYLKQ